MTLLNDVLHDVYIQMLQKYHRWTMRCAMRVLIILATLCMAALCLPRISLAEPLVRLPPGTRTDPHGQLISGRGLRDTSDFLAKELARRGIAVQQIGPYGVRGALITRFLSQTESTPWLAIHILLTSGKTLIFFVPRGNNPPTP